PGERVRVALEGGGQRRRGAAGIAEAVEPGVGDVAQDERALEALERGGGLLDLGERGRRAGGERVREPEPEGERVAVEVGDVPGRRRPILADVPDEQRQ